MQKNLGWASAGTITCVLYNPPQWVHSCSVSVASISPIYQLNCLYWIWWVLSSNPLNTCVSLTCWAAILCPSDLRILCSQCERYPLTDHVYLWISFFVKKVFIIFWLLYVAKSLNNSPFWFKWFSLWVPTTYGIGLLSTLAFMSPTITKWLYPIIFSPSKIFPTFWFLRFLYSSSSVFLNYTV